MYPWAIVTQVFSTLIDLTEIIAGPTWKNWLYNEQFDQEPNRLIKSTCWVLFIAHFVLQLGQQLVDFTPLAFSLGLFASFLERLYSVHLALVWVNVFFKTKDWFFPSFFLSSSLWAKKVLFMHDIGTHKLLTFMKNRDFT